MKRMINIYICVEVIKNWGSFPKPYFNCMVQLRQPKWSYQAEIPKNLDIIFFWIIPFITWGYWLPLEEAGCSLRLVTV